MRVKPLSVFTIYLGVVFVCAAAYYLIPGLFECPMSAGDSLYFSVVTITTLGYGDISPTSGLGKALAALQSLSGVLILGLFLIALSQQVVDNQNRQRLESAKENLKLQYEIWRRDTLISLIFLSNSNTPLNYQLEHELSEVNNFRRYFSENYSERWNAVANRLSSEDFYTIQITRGLDDLRRHIEFFILSTQLTDSASLKILTGYINGLKRMVDLDIDEYDDQKSFLSDLWGIMAHASFATGYMDEDHFLAVVNSIE